MVAFDPPRKSGTLFHLGLMTALALLAVWGLWQASQTDSVVFFILYLLPVILAVILVPLLVYRLLALTRAFYHLERDGISFRWGLRLEDIPIDAVQWVRSAGEVRGTLRSLPLPRLRWPGSVVGVKRLANGTQVEFMASESSDLVLVATQGAIYAISPEDPRAFLAAYQRLTELGSLTPLPARSVYPTFLLARVWQTPAARYLLLGGLALNLILLGWVGLVAPGRAQIVLGLQRGGETMPGIRLLLLPVLSGFFFLTDLFVGMYFYRREIGRQAEQGPPALNQTLAYLLWGSGAFTPLLFMLAVAYILLT
jgi:hypothetical protein